MNLKITKGNIKIDKNKLNKYKTVKEIFDNENKNTDYIIINDNIIELNRKCIENLSDANSKKIAKEIFFKYNKEKYFYNNGNKIIVTNSGINESITKIRIFPNQKILLKEHLIILSNFKK